MSVPILSSGFSAHVVADSCFRPESDDGSRLTTMVITYPRVIHSEWMTHRMFSRNTASSRAIPISSMIHQVQTNPFVPLWWTKNEAGMSGTGYLTGAAQKTARECYLAALKQAVDHARKLGDLGLHKQLVNRLLEPYMWVTAIYTGDERAWANFFSLRLQPDVEPHMYFASRLTYDAYRGSTPRELELGQWHLPFDTDDEPLSHTTFHRRITNSVATCARVSYHRHQELKSDEENQSLYNRLTKSRHCSPFEHVAFTRERPEYYEYAKTVDIFEPVSPNRIHAESNFDTCWTQLRTLIPNQCVSYMPTPDLLWLDGREIVS